MSAAFNFTRSADGIGYLTFDLQGEKVNKFSIPVLEELEKAIEALPKDGSIKLLAIRSGKENVFIAGADLHSFEPAFESPSIAEKIIRTGHRVFSKVEALPFPTVALINGACLGGGLEFALSCSYRFVSDNPKTQLGLPEVTLGIFPGWGGTQRLPRLVGLENALNMILTGKAVNGLKAFKMGLADGIGAWEFFEEKSAEFLQLLLTEKGREKIKEKRGRKSFRKLLLEANPLGRSFLFSQSKSQVLEKTKGRYNAPLIALDVIKQTATLPLNEGLKKEADTFIANIPEGFAIAKHLISLFFIQEALKKDPGASGVKPKEIRYAGLIGAGTMGSILAWLLTNNKIHTRIKDISWEIIGNAYSAVKDLYKKGVKNRKATPSEASLKFNLLSGTIDYSGFQHADFALEAATENLELKKKIFSELEQNMRADALIASNTSSLTIAEMSEGMKHPERFVGMHFFNPPNKMPLVEVVAGEKSSPEAIATAVDLSKKMGKTPIVVGDCPGFLVNRIFVQGANEALFMLEEGIPREVLSKKLLEFGMPMNPFILADEVGNDVAYKVTKTFEKAYGERMKGPKILDLLYDKKLFGKKAGKGFYLYEGEKITPNPEIDQLLASIKKPDQKSSEDEIVSRFISVMVNEAAKCLEEGVIKNPGYLDMALLMGIGFPPYRGGLLKYADEAGIEKIVSQLEALEKRYGVRYKPAQLLISMRDNKKSFYTNDYSSGPTQVIPSSNQRKSLLSTF